MQGKEKRTLSGVQTGKRPDQSTLIERVEMAGQNYKRDFPGPTTKVERPLFRPVSFRTVYSQSSVNPGKEESTPRMTPSLGVLSSASSLKDSSVVGDSNAGAAGAQTPGRKSES